MVTIKSSTTLLFALLIAGLGSACSTDPESAKREYLKSGDRYFEQKKYSEAIVQYRNALQVDAKFGTVRLKLAQTYEAMQDIPRAGLEYIRAADALPNDVSVQLKAATFLLMQGQFEDARSRAQKALKIDPKNATAMVLLGNALAGLKDLDSALKQLEDAAALDPSSASAYASLGTVQLARGSRPDAEAAFRKAVATNPKLSQAHMALGNFLWTAGRQVEAEESFKQALAIDPSDLRARRALALFYINNRRAPEAEPHLKALADADRLPSAPFKLALADYYVALNRPDDAVKVLENVTQAGSVAAARTRTASIQYRRKNTAQAHQAVDEVLAKDPKNVPALMVKARFLSAEGKLDEALGRARAAASADPRSIHAHYLLGELHHAKNETPEAIREFGEVLRLNPKAVAAQVKLSQLNLARGTPKPALEFARDAAKALPRNPAIALNLVRTLAANGRTREAQDLADRLVSAFPKVAAVHTAAGGVALVQRDRSAARRAFLRAIELQPNDFEALAGLVVISMDEGKPDEARRRIEERLSRSPADLRVSVLAAQTYAATGETRKAEEFLRGVVESDPDNLQAYGMLAQMYAAERRLPQARANLEAIVKQRPNALAAHTLIAMIYEMEGNQAEARKRYERVLQMDPAAPVAANNLAYLYAEDGGNLDVALQLAQTAKSKLPDVPQIDDTLGWVYYKKELASLAVPAFERAAQIAPEKATYRYHLSLAYAKVGEKAKARDSLEAALKLDAQSPLAQQARQALARN